MIDPTNMMNSRSSNRRKFLCDAGIGLGSIATSAMFGLPLSTAESHHVGQRFSDVSMPHFPPRAKNVIFLYMVGGPSHLDMFDHKPELDRYDGQVAPAEVIEGVPFEQIKTDKLHIMGSPWGFDTCGETGRRVTKLMPHTQQIIDELTFVRTVTTDETVHPFAELMLFTGHREAGRPSLGSWITYGLGSDTENLPGFVAFGDIQNHRSHGNIYSSGFLPATFDGVEVRSSGPPILGLQSPPGYSPQDDRQILDAISRLNALRWASTGDQNTAARMHAYDLAHRMQKTAPELLDIQDEPRHVLDMYGIGTDLTVPSFNRDCLLARRMVQRGVRFVQLTYGDWDHHGNIAVSFPPMARMIDQPCAALIQDLKQQGMLDDTLVIWGGEFGRTPVAQPQKTGAVGRDHHVLAFTMWMAGGGVRAGTDVGATDDLGFRPTTTPINVHDLQATILHLLGVDHEQLTYRFQGRDFRLTDVYGNIVHELLA